MAFGKVALSALLLLIAICGATVWLLFSPSDQPKIIEEVPDYKNLSSKQERFETERVILLSQDGKRKIGRLKSNASTLKYDQNQDKAALVEEMTDIMLLFQEELLENEQLIVQLKAKNAVYDYDQELFYAENVQIERYKLAGNELPQTVSSKPYFQGIAERARITFSDEKPTLYAFGLKAEFLQ